MRDKEGRDEDRIRDVLIKRSSKHKRMRMIKTDSRRGLDGYGKSVFVNQKESAGHNLIMRDEVNLEAQCAEACRCGAKEPVKTLSKELLL